MEAILKFNLPDEQHEFDCAIQGGDWMFAMHTLDQWLRSQIKYPSEEISEDTYRAYENAREKLYEILNENQLKL